MQFSEAIHSFFSFFQLLTKRTLHRSITMKRDCPKGNCMFMRVTTQSANQYIDYVQSSLVDIFNILYEYLLLNQMKWRPNSKVNEDRPQTFVRNHQIMLKCSTIRMENILKPLTQKKKEKTQFKKLYMKYIYSCFEHFFMN